MDKKSRFGELSTEELQDIVDNAVPATAKKATNFGIRLFNGTYHLKFRYFSLLLLQPKILYVDWSDTNQNTIRM